MKRFSQGQSTIEYLLLLTVCMLLIMTVLRSDAFRRYLGQDSEFFTLMRERFAYTYRHGRDGVDNAQIDYNTPHSHPTYSDGGSSRFFSGKDEYGGQ